MVAAPQSSLVVTWEKLPDDFVLDDEPVDNINQPAIAAALTESLALAGQLSDQALVMTNYGLCATVNGKTVVKAPDWGYVATIRASREEVKRSYTPQLQGDFPAIVMEFLSDTEGGEYSIKPTYPPGKWFFYEQVLQVPNYVIFEPESGLLEVYRLNESGQYELASANSQQQFWIDELGLALGVWQGTRENRTGYWLRWWNAQNELLPWGKEQAEQERQRAEQERQRAEQERQRAEQERQRAERLAAQLRAAGIEPEG
ncbi:Uma2 family endonuclease [Nodosilinea sp. LEGE 07088]|uniref:Uma2 family endonuclease n=1 Tax=Nodosilinea sp. LEGE 07088 TaxID=2777968 RepID=UPI00187E993E|nr:Uma2 family endonuclease [Nodosilinea sp. LEGE 07088]MBE9137890.1 Uma2 family endonuclease [Nodosilinea sp. LEGE 07088]